MPDDAERDEYFDRAQGVAEDMFGQRWRWSTYGHGEIPAWHPAMLGRKRGGPRTFGQDLRNGIIFLSIVFVIPALAIFVPDTARIIASATAGIAVVTWIVLAMAVARVRARNAQLRGARFPHPGEKGRHHHTSR